MVELVSVVGGGKLSRELDLSEVEKDINIPQTQYDTSKYHGIIARFSEGAPAILIYRSGSFSISGAKSIEELQDHFEMFEKAMEDLLSTVEYELEFEIRNLVHRTEIPAEETSKSLNLNALAIGLEVENVEYEPEQFPGIIYRPPDIPGLFLIFATGALVSTGHSDPDVAAEGIQKVTNRTIDLLQV